jgi:EAL domain-containing protein (putative c-di-GMP-specific phosphodiesterase class I)
MIMQVILTRYRDTLSRIDSFGKGNYSASEEIEKRATSSGGKTVEHIKTGNEFKQAIANNELQLHYQPILDMNTMKVRGFEALMRWNHPTRGFMPPNLFIPIAEDTGLIVPATDWVIRESCNAIQRLKALCPNLDDDVFMSVNFTAQDMLQDDFITKLKQVVTDTKINPAHVKLEMTERLLMNNPEKVRDMLNGCRDMGFKIAIDDFGTGYSSLSYLHHYPIDTLKIDRSFVIAMTKDESALNLVKGIINLAKTLKMDLVAEGIEEEAEEALLIENACDMAQGYKYSKPLPEDKLVEWVSGQ